MADDPQLTAQLQALRSQIDADRGEGITGAANRSQLVAQYNNLLAQQQSARRNTANAGTQATSDKAKADAEAARNKILGTAQGGIDRLQNDPTDQMLRQYLQQQMGGAVLDANGKPFQDGAPQYTAQGIQGQQGQGFTYDPASMAAARTQANTYDPTLANVQGMNASSVNYQDPFDAGTIQAMVNEQATGAGAAESARNQLMRDAVLANGGNAFDPSLRAAQAESMAERNRTVANARNQINTVANRENAATRNAGQLANAGFQQQASQFNTGAQNQNAQYNAGLQNQAGQFNASAQQNAANQNAAFQQGANQFNAGSLNQAGQFNAGNQQNASFQNAQLGQNAQQFNAGAQNQAGMFNVGNQMQAGQANFNAQQQAQMYNQGQRTGAAQQMGSYNNQRQGMLSDAEGRLINVVGQQVFRGPETQAQMPLPSFQQWSGGNATSGVTYAPGYNQPMGASFGNSATRKPVPAGNSGSGFTTSSFGPYQVGNPYGAGASVGTTKPAVNKTPIQQPGLAPQIKKPMDPGSFYANGF